jgi:hypothetical protein
VPTIIGWNRRIIRDILRERLTNITITIDMRLSEDKYEFEILQDKLKRKYESDKEKYCGWIGEGLNILPLMNPEHLTKNDLW